MSTKSAAQLRSEKFDTLSTRRGDVGYYAWVIAMWGVVTSIKRLDKKELATEEGVFCDRGVAEAVISAFEQKGWLVRRTKNGRKATIQSQVGKERGLVISRPVGAGTEEWTIAIYNTDFDKVG